MLPEVHLELLISPAAHAQGFPPLPVSTCAMKYQCGSAAHKQRINLRSQAAAGAAHTSAGEALRAPQGCSPLGEQKGLFLKMHVITKLLTFAISIGEDQGKHSIMW